MNNTQARHAEGTIEWEYRVPLLTSRFMLWDFARVILLSVAIMYALVAVTGWFVDGEFVVMPPVVFAVTAGVMAALFAVASLLLGNRFTMTFSVGPDGVSYESGARERRINRVTAVLGILGGSATTAGAGLLATARETGGWAWAELHEARYFPGQRVISLRNSWRTVIRLHCTAETYEAVRAVVEEGIAREAGERAVAAASVVPRPKRPWWSVAAGVAAPIVAGVLATAWPWLAYEDGMRWLVVPVLLLVAAGVLRIEFGRLAALLSLGPLAYVLFLTAREAFSSSAGFSPGEVFYGWELDTGLLVLTLLGEAALVALAAWRLLRRETAEA
ncbi:MAG: hypothetical protein JXP72_10325 [Coriobacteriia bacterium]|nr:hypothetical protein [Coriobacteriia bacterium]